MTDLIQLGNIALLKAVDRYQSSLPMRFIDYACWHIHYIICNEIQHMVSRPRITPQMREMLDKTRMIRRYLRKKTGRKPDLKDVIRMLRVVSIN